MAETPGTWTHAQANGWDWPATFAEVVTITHAEWYLDVHRDRKLAPSPIVFPRPWSEKDLGADVTVEERAALRAVLAASSPFGPD